MPDIMQSPITVFDSSSAAAILEQKTRWTELCASFEKRYGKKPDYIARAPGRVSIIGEHIDYAGLSVLPAAIDRDVLMACSATSSAADASRISVANVNARFAAETVEYTAGSRDGPILDPKAHSWVNYFKAGLKGVLGHLSDEALSNGIKLSIMVDGNVPPGGGLSSSAAMVVSSAIAVLQAYDYISQTTQGQLAEIAITSERLVGVNSGGMDQSASIFSRQSYLLNVGFVPKLVATLVPFPTSKPSLRYVIANTLVTSEKQKTSKYNYNLRVVELRVAARLLIAHLQLEEYFDDDAENLPTLKHVMDAHFASSSTHTSIDFLMERQRRLSIMLHIVEEVFGASPDIDSWEDVRRKLGGISQEQFAQRFHPHFEIEAQGLKLYQRSKHAYSEARRVYQYRALLESANETTPGLGDKLGDLMNDSQSSCRDLFECSCPEIEDVCLIARKAGALGSRLSGAGWGGCTVHLVPEEMQENLISDLKKEYYNKHFPDLTQEQLEEAVFATKPEEGACLYSL